MLEHTFVNVVGLEGLYECLYGDLRISFVYTYIQKFIWQYSSYALESLGGCLKKSFLITHTRAVFSVNHTLPGRIWFKTMTISILTSTREQLKI